MIARILFLLFFSSAVLAQKHVADTTFYASGKVQYITTVEYDKREVTYFSEKGNRLKKYTFINNSGDGIWTWYYHDGGKKEEIDYRNNVKEGKCFVYSKNGSKIAEGNYEKGLLSGPFKYFYEGGALLREDNYSQGLRDGLSHSYYKSGKVRSKRQFDKGKEQGDSFEYYESGKKKIKTSYEKGRPTEVIVYNESGASFDGNLDFRDENGLPEMTGKCVKGRPDGDLKVFHEDTLLAQMHYTKGKPDGNFLFYDKKGKVWLTEVFEDGKFVKEIKDKNAQANNSERDTEKQTTEAERLQDGNNYNN